ncbi:hypothetical protein T09_15082 [Trichinella sp. T9]|nr:hypothetical protein T09_15082 [Trichinella sp. T9]
MAQVGCRRSVACLSFRSMTDLGYYYSPMAGDHLTITGHTGHLQVLPEIVNGAICRLQSELDKANVISRRFITELMQCVQILHDNFSQGRKYGTPATPLQPEKLILRSKQADMTLLDNQLTPRRRHVATVHLQLHEAWDCKSPPLLTL